MQALKDEITGVWTITGIEGDKVTFNRMCNMLRDNIPFKFARYGDGEINCMNGKKGANCDKHEYFDDLGEQLRLTLSPITPDYMIGIQPLSVSHMRESVDRYFGHIPVLYNADVIHNASIDGVLRDLFVSIDRPIILVGPPHLTTAVPGAYHIAISPLNCWKDFERTKEELALRIDKLQYKDDPVVMLCCSMMAEVLISHFRHDKTTTFIDMGSVLDPYAGAKSRRYHHKLNINALQ